MKNAFLFFCFLTLSQALLSQVPQINAVTASSDLVEQYGKFEATLDLTATYSNPYDYDQVVVSAVFTAPDGTLKTVDGFYMRDYDINTSSGVLIPLGTEGRFKVRFSPDQIGNWTFQLTVTDANGSDTFNSMQFECFASEIPENKGFVRANQTNYLNFDNGEQYIPIGENMAWQDGNIYQSYFDWLTKLSENDGNFIRLWHAHWGLGIEWESGWSNFQGLRRYHEEKCRYQDWLYDFCAENGIYVMLCLQHHGPVSTEVNANWHDSPYNAVNGGPCQNTWDFFTNESAIAHTKNRYRYVVARWGYARSIMAWELFNEVEWTDDFELNKDKVADWHAEMATFLKEKDPYQHLVTTSYAHDNYDPVVWANPEMDITQTHFYINTSNIERALVNGIEGYLNNYGKPTLTGEFGLGGNSDLANADPTGIHIHNALWATLFGGGLGAGMTWWWDSYIHPKDLYYHFASLASVADEIPFLDENMMPANIALSGTSGDLVLTPVLGWAGIGEGMISIDENGLVNPSNPGLASFLYGSEWNTQYRSPPTFTAYYPDSGQFIVRTGAEAATDPKIAIYLNGNLVLEEDAGPNQTFSVNVPSGQNTIKADNTGTDWINIASYTFTGLGSKIDAYALISEGKNIAAGWVLNNQYNHQYVDENGEPDPAWNGQIKVEGFQDGQYSIFWYDCLSGDIVDSEAVFAQNNELLIPVPGVFWDRAFVVNSDPVQTKRIKETIAFKLFPNPATAGATLRISVDFENNKSAFILLTDGAGKTVERYKFRRLSSGQQDLNIRLPGNLPAGLYWLRLKSKGKLGSRPIVIGN